METSFRQADGTLHDEPLAEITGLVQEADRVEVEVTSTSRRVRDGCQDPLVLELDAPLGDRPLIDARTGEQVEVRSPAAG